MMRGYISTTEPSMLKLPREDKLRLTYEIQETAASLPAMNSLAPFPTAWRYIFRSRALFRRPPLLASDWAV